MRKYRKTTAYTPSAIQLKKRILRTRSRAKFVGFIYLFATIALAAAACLPLLVHDLAPIGVTEFWKAFTDLNVEAGDGLIKTVNCGLYALMLLGLLINAFRTFGKLGWLTEKNATQEYGFNRNVYAMEALGRIFSGSYAVILVTYFLIALLCQVSLLSLEMIGLAVIGAGALIHILLGVMGMKTGRFDIVDGEIAEQRRVLGRFAPFFRNLVQIAVVVGMMYFFLEANVQNAMVTHLLRSENVMETLTGDTVKLIVFATEVVAMLCLFVLIKHATGLAEFNPNGTLGSGMRNFRVFSFFIFLAMGGAVAVEYFMAETQALNTELAIVAVIALAAFVFELLMKNRPRNPEVIGGELSPMANGEMSLGDISAQYGQGYAESPMPREPMQGRGAAPRGGRPPMAGGPMQPYPYPYPYPLPQPFYSPMMYNPAIMMNGALSHPNNMFGYGGVNGMGMAPMLGMNPKDVKAAMKEGQLLAAQQPAVAPLQIASTPAPAPVATQSAVTYATETKSVPVAEEVKPVKVVKEVTPVVAPVVEDEVEDEDEEEVTAPVWQGKPGKIDVVCPHCGKTLRVNGETQYHRCPSCEKILQLRKTSAPAKKASK